MKSTLRPGASADHAFAVTEAQTVPCLPIGNDLFTDIPNVLATANMIAMMEATATKVLAAHLDTGEGSLGILVDVTHLAATVPGQIVTVTAEITAVEGRRITFKVSAHDGLDKIGEGTHQRMIVPWDRFKAGVAAKAAKASALSYNWGSRNSRSLAIPKTVARKPQPITVDEFLSEDAGLPEKVELIDGEIGPYSDAGKLTLLANWGADEIIRLTGRDVWFAALAALDGAGHRS